MAKCIIHEKAVVANDGICPRCKACKHTSWWKRDGDARWKCANCYIESAEPNGEKWLLKDGKWEEIK